jgi:hypothetical protein
VFLEAEQRGGVVQQHVGVEGIDALACGHARRSRGEGGGRCARRPAFIAPEWPRGRPARARAP